MALSGPQLTPAYKRPLFSYNIVYEVGTCRILLCVDVRERVYASLVNPSVSRIRVRGPFKTVISRNRNELPREKQRCPSNVFYTQLDDKSGRI